MISFVTITVRSRVLSNIWGEWGRVKVLSNIWGKRGRVMVLTWPPLGTQLPPAPVIPCPPRPAPVFRVKIEVSMLSNTRFKLSSQPTG